MLLYGVVLTGLLPAPTGYYYNQPRMVRALYVAQVFTGVGSMVMGMLVANFWP
jgi:hypothetical protein